MDDETQRAVRESGVQGTDHLYLTVYKNDSWLLTAAAFNSTAALSVCEFHGPLGRHSKLYDPPNERKNKEWEKISEQLNMYKEWWCRSMANAV